MAELVEEFDMPKVTYAELVAECGHPYMGYTYDQLWARCPECMTRMRLNMQAENRHREYLLRKAASQAPRKTYWISPVLRQRVYERDQWICQLCSDPVDPGLSPNDIWAPTLDHIVCRSWVDEPDHSEANLRLAHRWCNAVRGNESTHSADVLAPPAA